LAFYRNYNAPNNDITGESPWVIDPMELIDFMGTVHVNYGWGNEAVEAGLF